jgi:hypothetical protein
VGDENSLAGTTKAHKHSLLASDGGYLDEGVTGLTGGINGEVLTCDGTDIPIWAPNTSNPLVKVSKTFADIVANELDIYTLPQDSALVNVFTDITTLFDVATAVTIGDALDDNGFVTATDWTSGLGLTDSTRGVYITQFKGMRSTTGTTSIKAYNFASESTFTNSNYDANTFLYATTVRTELCQLYQAGQVLISESVCKASWFIRDSSQTATGSLKAYIRQSDGTQIEISTTILDASTVTSGYTEYTFEFPSTTLTADDMICINSDDMTNGSVEVQAYGANITDGLVYRKESGSYVAEPNNSVTGTITYGCATVTQGEVDFYLQVVD